MENDWVLIYETDKGFEAEIIKGMLKEHDIEVFIRTNRILLIILEALKCMFRQMM